MSEEKVEMQVEEESQDTAQEATEAPAESKEPRPDIAAEFQNLGRNLAAVTKAVLESPEAQDVSGQVQRGLESLEKSVQQLATHARESKVGKKVESGVGEATTAVKERGLFETLADSFFTALHTVNVTLEQTADKIQSHSETVKAEKAKPQPIEVVTDEEEGTAEPEAGEE